MFSVCSADTRYIRSTRLRFRYASSRSGIRPVSPSSNILIRVNSHRIFSSSLHCSLLIEYYSITVATRPDPTVRPPSRYQTGVLRCTNGDFSCDSWEKIQIFRCVHVVFGDFVIMVLSLFHIHFPSFSIKR